jgi:hypothetical protein
MEELPEPPVLTRQSAMPITTLPEDVQMGEETTQERLTRYLQYDCTYKHCKYQDPLKTWGEIIREDYPHFLELMSQHVPLNSKTFDVLKSELNLDDVQVAENTIRFIDLPENKGKQQEAYLQLTCTHRGRMHGKTWGDILKKDYNYFLWSVGNTMSRETRTFNTLVKCLKDADQHMVRLTPKGKVRVSKKKPHSG